MIIIKMAILPNTPVLTANWSPQSATTTGFEEAKMVILNAENLHVKNSGHREAIE